MRIKLKIINGFLKNRNIFITKNTETRPVMNRVRQNVFDILNNIIDFENSKVLDICCGSGILGIECISRGSQKCYFIDSSEKAIKELKKNFEILDIFPLGAFFYKNIFHINKGEEVDLIFIDLPYNSGFLVKKILKKIFIKNWLGLKTLVIILINKKENFEDNSFEILREKIISNKKILFLKKKIQNLNKNEE